MSTVNTTLRAIASCMSLGQRKVWVWRLRAPNRHRGTPHSPVHDSLIGPFGQPYRKVVLKKDLGGIRSLLLVLYTVYSLHVLSAPISKAKRSELIRKLETACLHFLVHIFDLALSLPKPQKLVYSSHGSFCTPSFLSKSKMASKKLLVLDSVLRGHPRPLCHT